MWNYVVQAGMIGYILVGISVLSIGVVFDRILYWLLRGRAMNKTDREEVVQAFLKGEYEQVRRLVAKRENGPEARALRVLLDHIGMPDDAPLDIALSREQRESGRWLTILEVNGSVAPMLGILGTVVGIIQAFQGMRNSSTPDTAIMVAGISLSMLTTAIGLIVALTSLVPYNIFAAKAHRTQVRLAEFLQECWMLTKREPTVVERSPQVPDDKAETGTPFPDTSSANIATEKTVA